MSLDQAELLLLKIPPFSKFNKYLTCQVWVDYLKKKPNFEVNKDVGWQLGTNTLKQACMMKEFCLHWVEGLISQTSPMRTLPSIMHPKRIAALHGRMLMVKSAQLSPCLAGLELNYTEASKSHHSQIPRHKQEIYFQSHIRKGKEPEINQQKIHFNLPGICRERKDSRGYYLTNFQNEMHLIINSVSVMEAGDQMENTPREEAAKWTSA